MKRIVMLATLLAFVLGMAATASASDLVATGSMYVRATWSDNGDFLDSDVAGANDSASEDDLSIQERLRLSFDFIANENLKGVLQLEIGDVEWGNGAGALGTDQIAIEVKHAYVNFVWPNTSVNITAGLMPVALPGGPGGNPILDDDMAALVVSAPLTDSVSLLTGYTRLEADLASGTNNDEAATTDNFLDAVFIAVPLDFDGVALTPYAAFAYSGGDFLADFGAANVPGLLSQNTTIQDADATGVNITYFGLTFDVSLLDPFNITGAFHYGAMHGPWENLDRSGWLGEVQLQYTGWDMVTPSLYFAYSSGEDDNATDSSNGGSSERLPVISSGFAPSAMFFDETGGVGAEQMGFWTVGLFLDDISFVEGLTHAIKIMYIEGTNDENIGTAHGPAAAPAAGTNYGRSLTTKDSLWELDINNTYQIYDELTAGINFGYIWTDFKDENWTAIAQDQESEEDAGYLRFIITYSF